MHIDAEPPEPQQIKFFMEAKSEGGGIRILHQRLNGYGSKNERSAML